MVKLEVETRNLDEVQQALDESKVPAPEKKLFLLIRTGISLMMYHNVV